MSEPVVSVVLGTLNRLAHLMPALDSIEPACDGLAYEIVVVDGGSTDGTEAYLRAFPGPLKVIWQGTRRGAVAAFNAGFAAARGTYVANFNDDALYRGPVLRQAVAYLELHPACGQVAIPFRDPTVPQRVETVTAGVKRRVYTYANFGVIRRWLGEAVGWWGQYHHYGGDTDLSLEVWKAGYSVEPLKAGGSIEHARTQDAIRIINYSDMDFRNKWKNWSGEVDAKNPPIV